MSAMEVHGPDDRDPSLEVAAPIRPDQDVVRVERAGEVTVLTPLGAMADPIDDDLAAEIERAAERGALVLDLSEVTLVDGPPVIGVAGLVQALVPDSDRACLVCRRGSGRGVLRTWGVTRAVAVFTSVGDALQARRFAREGYGPGWAPRGPRG